VNEPTHGARQQRWLPPQPPRTVCSGLERAGFVSSRTTSRKAQTRSSCPPGVSLPPSLYGWSASGDPGRAERISAARNQLSYFPSRVVRKPAGALVSHRAPYARADPESQWKRMNARAGGRCHCRAGACGVLHRGRVPGRGQTACKIAFAIAAGIQRPQLLGRCCWASRRWRPKHRGPARADLQDPLPNLRPTSCKHCREPLPWLDAPIPGYLGYIAA